MLQLRDQTPLAVFKTRTYMRRQDGHVAGPPLPAVWRAFLARKFLFLIATIIFLLVAAFAIYRLFPQQIFAAAFVPSTEFVKPEEVETSAYADKDMWFSRPEITGSANPSLWTPEGFEPTDAPKVAVFYVHPTSYMKREFWNAPLGDKESQDRARIFLRSQASVFNGIGQIWAPRYRQAAIGAFLTDKPEAQMAFDAAYSDVVAGNGLNPVGDFVALLFDVPVHAGSVTLKEITEILMEKVVCFQSAGLNAEFLVAKIALDIFFAAEQLCRFTFGADDDHHEAFEMVLGLGIA